MSQRGCVARVRKEAQLSPNVAPPNVLHPPPQLRNLSFFPLFIHSTNICRAPTMCQIMFLALGIQTRSLCLQAVPSSNLLPSIFWKDLAGLSKLPLLTFSVWQHSPHPPRPSENVISPMTPCLHPFHCSHSTLNKLML